jgi:rare lipoprotein A
MHRTLLLAAVPLLVIVPFFVISCAQAQCRVNDRGPFVRGRIIDLSVSAARALGMTRSGLIHVSVE